MTRQLFGEPVWDVAQDVEMAHGALSSDVSPEEPERPVAHLWLPDPEQRHGWREHYIWCPERPEPRRHFGFQACRRSARKET